MYRAFYRHVICRMDPEFAHRFGVWSFRWFGWMYRALRGTPLFPERDPSGAIDALGLRFPGPLGLAAGMDKNATAVRGLAAAGFAFVEVGTLTPVAQPGNPRPRSWREVDVRGLRNQMGFNNGGAERAAKRLRRLRRHPSARTIVIGANIGKNKVTTAEDAPGDYRLAARALAPWVDYLVVNVSSPNTPGLRDLQSADSLKAIVRATREGAGRTTPILVKIAPDLADADIDAIVDVVVAEGIGGVVATNTTINHDRGPGGLSGPPLRERALEVVARIAPRLGPGQIVIGVGGIESAADARALLDAGATLVQAYTALVYEGPSWPARVNAELTRPAA